MNKKIIGILICGLFFISAYSGATVINENNSNLIEKTSMYNEPFTESIKQKMNLKDCNMIDNFLLNDPPGEWIKNYGKKYDGFNFVRITDDDGFIATGFTRTYGPGTVPIAWLVKTDSDGVMEWNKTYGADDINGCYGYRVFQTTDGGYIIVGNKAWLANDNNAWLVKTDEKGNVEWESTFGGIDFDRCFYVVEVNDGYYLCGRTYSLGNGDADGWVIKTDITGKKLWEKTYGGAYYDNFYTMAKVEGGGFVLTGTSYSYNEKNWGDFWCVKIDNDGKELWSKTYGYSGNDTARSVFPTVDNGFIIGGDGMIYDEQTENFSGVGAVIKIDNAGTMQWMKSYSRSQFDEVLWLDPTADGGYILTGDTLNAKSSGFDIWLVKTDSSGNMEWQRTFQKSFSYRNGGTSVQQIDDSSYIVGGDYYKGMKDNAYLLKTTNTPPFKPDLPTGETNGKAKREYTYTTKAIDQNNDQLYYLFDWGDGINSSWLGPYNSGETIEAKHVWTEKGNYEINVKAKDLYDLESLWSDSLPITMPYFYNPILQFFERLFERFPNAFPLLRQLIG